MSTATDLSFLHLILNASLLVQLVMLSLVLVSIVSWTMIFNKRVMLNRAKKAADIFEGQFWSLEDLSPLYNRISNSRNPATGMEKIFEAGFEEFARLRGQENTQADAIIEGAQRAMRIAMNKEIDNLETNLSFLATVGSTSPYVGLFGTVWGIMNSFRAWQCTTGIYLAGCTGYRRSIDSHSHGFVCRDTSGDCLQSLFE